MQASAFLKSLKNLSKEDLLEVKGIGEVLAQNFLDFLESDRYKSLVVNFEKLEQDQTNGGVEIIATQNQSETQSLPLSGQSICITGTFDISRPEIQSKLEKLGAKVTNSVTSKTTTLLAGEKAGSKLDKAKELGVEIVNDLEEFFGSVDVGE